jgi:hypothetical protein
LLAGLFRYACHNGLVVGQVVDDIRIPHRGDVQDRVIDGAFRVLEEFEAVDASTQAMKALELDPEQEVAFATSALMLRFGERGGDKPPAPITADQLLTARRPEDLGHSLWAVYQRVAENSLRGGLPGRSRRGRRLHTRPVNSIDRSVGLNRALWMLAEQTRRLHG